MKYHEPVLAAESMEWLFHADSEGEGTYIDATFGGGGHSRLILQRLNPQGALFAFDQDADVLEHLPDDPRFTFIHHNFRYMREFMEFYGVEQVDGILADLGVSSHQLDTAERGFSWRFEAALDMRMSQDRKQTAADVLNTYSPEALQEVFSRYGELINSRSLAQHLAKAREKKPFKTIGDLLKEAEPFVRGHRPKYLAKLFQALRIEVNEEMEVLGDFLRQSLDLLAPGGRLVVIAYHSVEDRLVKRFLKTGNPEGEVIKDEYGKILRPFKLLSRKPLLPSAEEIRRNPRARSAKMRGGIVLRKNSPEP
ncbi:MAG TPA: 16S rRNA (cytosine(1402)-N(4))-methyltransferase RsmH [Phaeodactylibacter sp.]|nr:16S rRNA (cytosine(1402)-N(4))-methyltransferase RsmH [Phaeodactylibacter sp.]